MIYSISYFVYLLNETLDKQLYDATIKEKYKIKNQVSNKSQVVILLVNLRGKPHSIQWLIIGLIHFSP